MTGEVIKSFLVGLGFGVDDASLTKFNASIVSASKTIGKLYAATVGAASAIVYGVAKISESFEQLGYEYRLITPAINKAIILRRELFKAYAAAGINIREVVLNSVKLNLSLTKTKFALEAIYKSVGSRFFTFLTKQSDILRAKIYQNMPKILAVLERLVKWVFVLLNGLIRLGMRLFEIFKGIYDFFVLLDQKTQGTSTKILAFLAAVLLLMSPLAVIIGSLTALLLLFDDYKTWKEGGKSLFDWSSFDQGLKGLKEGFKGLWHVIQDLLDVAGDVRDIVEDFFVGEDSSKRKTVFQALNDDARKLYGTVLDIGGLLKTFYKFTLFSSLNGENGVLKNNIDNFNPSVPHTPLLSAMNNSSQATVNLQQQTTINTSPGADAAGIGKAYNESASSQNRDLVRDLQTSFIPGGFIPK